MLAALPCLPCRPGSSLNASRIFRHMRPLPSWLPCFAGSRSWSDLPEIQLKWIHVRRSCPPLPFQLPEERRKRPRSEAARASLVTDQQRPPPMSAHVRTGLQISGAMKPRQIIGSLQFSAFLPPCMCPPGEYTNRWLSSWSYGLKLFEVSLFSCLHCSPRLQMYAAMHGT